MSQNTKILEQSIMSLFSRFVYNLDITNSNHINMKKQWFFIHNNWIQTTNVGAMVDDYLRYEYNMRWRFVK